MNIYCLNSPLRALCKGFNPTLGRGRRNSATKNVMGLFSCSGRWRGEPLLPPGNTLCKVFRKEGVTHN